MPVRRSGVIEVRTPAGSQFLPRILILFAGVILALGIGTTSASANAPLKLPGISWFGGKGVSVCAPSTDPYCNGELHVGGVAWNWWQCVELAQRFYQKQGWYPGTFPVDFAYQIYDVAGSMGMSRQANGAITSIVPGDMIVHGPTSPKSDGAGHVSIVDSVSGSTINVVEQNTGSTDGRGTYSFDGRTLSRWGSASYIRGVVHSPKNAGRPAQPSSPKVVSTTSNSAVLSWGDVSNNETSFASQYRVGSGAWVAGPSVGANATSMTVTGLNPSTAYTFQVGARNSAGTKWSVYFYGTTTALATYHAGRQISIDSHASGGVSGHEGPADAYAAGPTRPANSPLWIVCYVTGQLITGPYGSTNIWDLSDDGYYYTDAWLYTGSNNPVVPPCALKTVSIDSHATGGVSGHRGPANSYAVGPTHPANSQLTIACYVDGQAITGPYGTTTIWDLADDGYYYTDAWLYTGSNNPVVPHC